MGNRPQQIHPKLLIFRHDCRLFFFSRTLFPIQCHGALSQNRKQDTVLKHIQWLLSDENADHTISVLCRIDGKVQIRFFRKTFCHSSRPFPVFQNPLQDFLFFLIKNFF